MTTLTKRLQDFIEKHRGADANDLSVAILAEFNVTDKQPAGASRHFEPELGQLWRHRETQRLVRITGMPGSNCVVPDAITWQAVDGAGNAYGGKGVYHDISSVTSWNKDFIFVMDAWTPTSR